MTLHHIEDDLDAGLEGLAADGMAELEEHVAKRAAFQDYLLQKDTPHSDDGAGS